MGISAIRHRARCDVCGVAREGDNYFVLLRDLEGEGWAFGRKKNGERARRGGKDYCARCKPGPDGEVAP